jgi:hypothetical protein
MSSQFETLSPRIDIGPEADIRNAKRHLRSPPIATAKSGIPQKACLLNTKADRCGAKRNVGYRPLADITAARRLVCQKPGFFDAQ